MPEQENAPEIKVGSVVSLRSKADLKMTVEKIDGDEVTCAWFDVHHQLHHHIFDRAILFVATV